ncbi:MAG: response regulator transcription factor [Alphaproteobacteria bacterium]|nr:response regulator transcription factor [Alphaproteobacteria bacterium]MCB9700136.1 response regulator transcription factor [Alphaproteobacteria bacterium]
MARILLVDDDPNLLDVLSMTLEDAGHDVITAKDGVAGLRKVEQGAPELLVSDVNMPGIDGFTLCRRLREKGHTLPIVLLTARDTEIDQALGLELGADDYVIKPFSARVLLARVSALLRREQLRAGPSEERTVIAAGELELETERMEARYRGQLFVTTVTEFRLLCVIATRPGVVYTREQLLDRIRGDDSVVVERLIDTYVRRLRRKIEEIDPTFDGIETMVGAGYRWRDR